MVFVTFKTGIGYPSEIVWKFSHAAERKGGEIATHATSSCASRYSAKAKAFEQSRSIRSERVSTIIINTVDHN